MVCAAKHITWGCFMGVLYPSEAVARRWNGALQIRLRRVPLQQFLKKRGIAPAPGDQDNEDLIRATTFIVNAGLLVGRRAYPEGLVELPYSAVGRTVCIVSRALAGLIMEPAAWRIAALESTARLLTPTMGLTAAAIASAVSVRHFQNEPPHSALEFDVSVGERTIAAIRGRVAVSEVSALIAMSLWSPRVRQTERAG
jgi:hypothetical protein